MNFCDKCVHHVLDTQRFRWSTEIHRCNHLKDQTAFFLMDSEEEPHVLRSVSCFEYRYGMKETNWTLAGREICGLEGKFYQEISWIDQKVLDNPES